MAAYYNEFDPHAAAWLRELIREGLITDGVVDERSICEVQPADVAGFERVHFFAGIGGWDYALNLAGWSGPVWTGSCPCQPFSAAGKRKGTADERHLWPEFARLIRACQPATVFGEQVASKDGRAWLSGVFADLEGMGYQRAGADLCAAGVGEKNHPIIEASRHWFIDMADVADAHGNYELADELRLAAAEVGGIIVGSPHIRQRLYWVADSTTTRCAGAGQGTSADGDGANSLPQRRHPLTESSGCGSISRMAHADSTGSFPGEPAAAVNRYGSSAFTDGCNSRMADPVFERFNEGRHERLRRGSTADPASPDGRVGDTLIPRLERHSGNGDDGNQSGRDSTNAAGSIAASGRDCWSDFDLIPCGDGKTRRIKSGLEPLVARLSDCLDRMLSIETAGLKATSHGNANCTDSAENVRVVRSHIQSEAGRSREATGMRLELHETQILLDFLLCCEAALSRGSKRCGFEKAGAEVRRRIVRGVPDNEGSDGSPRRWESTEQQCRKSSDALCQLSFVLARLAESHRKAARDAHAAAGRVAILRGYGNAIVPQVAAEFIAACREAVSIERLAACGG